MSHQQLKSLINYVQGVIIVIVVNINSIVILGEEPMINLMLLDESGPSIDLAYKLGGHFPDGIDVAALCPMLLAIADLIKTSNRTILATDKEIAVFVKPVKEGSYWINLALQAKTALENSLLSQVSVSELEKLQLLLKSIGLIAGGGVGLIKLIQFLRTTPKEVKRTTPDSVEYTNESGNKLTVNGSVHALYQNCMVIALVDKAIAKPLKFPNVMNLETFLSGHEAQTKVTLEKKDAELIENAIGNAVPAVKTAPQNDNSQKVWVTPKTGNYEGQPTSWSFRKVGDKSSFRAKLTDEGFLLKLKTGEVRLSGKDTLYVMLSELQNLQEGTLQRTITHVIEYREAPLQTNLFSKSEESK